MGNINIGRLGSLGIALETVAGTPNTTMSAYLNYSDGPTLRGHQEPIENISAKTSRIMDTDSVGGKKWGEGDVQILADTHLAGYLWKLALGNELYTTGTPSQHLFYPSVSGNTPKTATLIYSRGDTDVEQYAMSAIDELTFEVADEYATLSASFMSKFPTTGAAQTVTTTSGYQFAFKDYFVQFGGTLTLASTAATTPLSDFSLTIANNAETIYRSQSADVSALRSKGLRVSGSYTLFFDDVITRDAYYGLNKRSMILTASGNIIGSATESFRIRLAEFRLDEAEVSTGLDDFYTIKANFVAEDDVDAVGTRLCDVLLTNDKASLYA